MVRVAARKAHLSADAQNDWAEYKLDAERKAGSILSGMDLHGGDRRSISRSHDVTLNDIGVSKAQSSRWQTLAGMPEADYTETVADLRGQGELTEAGVLRVAKHVLRVEQKRAAELDAQREQSSPGVPDRGGTDQRR